MFAKSSLAIAVIAFLIAGRFDAQSVSTQSSTPGIEAELRTQYKLTQMRTENGVTSVLQQGTVLIIQKDGVLGVPPVDSNVPQTTYKEGVLQPGAASRTSRFLRTGEKVNVTKIEVDSKNDKVVLTIVECDPCNDAQQPSSFMSKVVFEYPKGYLQIAEPSQVQDVIAEVLTPQPISSAPPNVSADRTTTCSDFESCMRDGNQAFQDGQWDQAFGYFWKASSLEPTKHDALTSIGSVYLASAQYEKLPALWDRELNMGGSLSFLVCRPRLGVCQSDRSNRGSLILTPKLLSFVTPSGDTVFSASPQEVTSVEVANKRRPLTRNELHMKVKGKNYDFYLVPLGIDCGKEETAYCEEDAAVGQQLAVFTYFTQAIPKLVAGSLGKP